MREVELHTGLTFNVRVVVELSPVVGSDRTEAEAVPPDKVDDALAGLMLCSVSEFPDEYVPCLALDESDDAMVVATAYDGIDFPMPLDTSRLN